MSTAMAPDARRDFPIENAARVGLVAALSATTMLFASLVSACVVRRSFADWQPASGPWPIILGGFALAASAAIEGAARARGGRRSLGLMGLALSSALYISAAFYVIGSTASGEDGLRSPFDAFAVLFLGVHVFHALIGAAFAVRILRRSVFASDDALLLVRVVTHFLTALLLGIIMVLFGLR